MVKQQEGHGTSPRRCSFQILGYADQERDQKHGYYPGAPLPVNHAVPIQIAGGKREKKE